MSAIEKLYSNKLLFLTSFSSSISLYMFQIINNTFDVSTSSLLFFPDETREENTSGSIVRWCEASTYKRPALVFIPGYLTERPDSDEFDQWTTNIKYFAQKYDFASYGMYWPSGRLLDIIDTDFSPTVSVLSTALNGLDAWKEALKRADQIAVQASKWISQLRRPVILVGHSLGARIVLKSAEYVEENRILCSFCMAPAVGASEISFETVRRANQYKGAIFYSENDWVLKYIYPLGRTTDDVALGLEFQSQFQPKYIKGIDVGLFDGEPVYHNTYADICGQILSTSEVHNSLEMIARRFI